MEIIFVLLYLFKLVFVIVSLESLVEIQNLYLYVEFEKEVVFLVFELLFLEDVGSVSIENSDMLVFFFGFDYEFEGVLDNSLNFQKNLEELNLEVFYLFDVYLEEYFLYLFLLYLFGEFEGLGEDLVSMCLFEIIGQVFLFFGKRINLCKIGLECIVYGMRVKFNFFVLLLDLFLEGEFDFVQRIIYEVDDLSLFNDEGIMVFYNVVCVGYIEIVKFLVQFGVNVNVVDSDGWILLYCVVLCNNV